MPSLNVASPDCGATFFAGRAARCTHLQRAASLADLRAILADRARDSAPEPVTLDLIGHGTRGHRLLRLGQTAVNMLDPAVAGFFRRLAADGMLTRNAVGAVRLIGCETAVTEAGQRTMRMLARELGLPVYGTLVPLVKSHFGATGLDPAFSGILVAALPRTPGVIVPDPGPGCH